MVRSIPRSRNAWMATGLISPVGLEPAERTCTFPGARWAAIAAAICERPALWTQTNKISGTVLAIAPEACAAAVSRSLACRVTRIGRKVGIRDCGSSAARACWTASVICSRVKTPSN